MVVFLIALGTIVGTTTAASAEKKRGGKSGEFDACLSVSHKGAGIDEIGIGVDVFPKPGESSDAILAQPGNVFSALLMGPVDEDSGGQDELFAHITLFNPANTTRIMDTPLLRINI